MKRAAVLVFVTGWMVLTGCQDSSGSAPGAGPRITGGGGAGGDGGVCSRPEEGCACTPGTAPVICHTEPAALDGEVVCGEGQRYCRGGFWGGCESIRTYTLGSDDEEVAGARAALIDGPLPCNPCNPGCNVARDYPTAGDLTPSNSTDVRYDPAAGGIILDGGTGTGGLTDSDGDGVPDDADDCVGPGYRAPCDGSAMDDGFYHTLPFGGPAELDPLPIDVQVRTADVYFLMDTTGSMGGEITNLRNSLTTGTFIPGCSGGIIGAIQCTIPDAWFGVGGYDDYPVSPYGRASSGDTVFYHLQDINASVGTTQAAVNTLTTHNGRDWPESQTQALWATVTGGGLGPYLAARTGCPGTTWGYPCFRDGTIPIVVHFTDAPFHNGPNPSYDYGSLGGGGGVTLPPTTPVSGNETWATAHVTGDAATTWTGYTGSTSSMNNDYNFGCNGQSSRDAVFEFTVSTTSTVTLSLEGSGYDTVLGLFNSSFSEIACNDDSVGLQSQIVRTLSPGTYYAVVDGYWGSSGSYRFSVGVPATPMVSYPVSWSDTVNELTNRNTRVITVYSGGTGNDGHNDVLALANSTGSTDSGGNPFVFTIPSNGSGLSTAVVDAIVDLANYSRLDISAQAVDNPATGGVDERDFVDSIAAISFPPGRCTGITAGTTFEDCLPGTSVNFEASFRNDVVMPTAVPQVFDFTIEVLGDGTFVLATVPVRIVVPPDVPMFPLEGRYSRDYDANVRCDIPPQRPDWGTFDWTATTPPDSAIRFEFQTAATQAGLAAAPAISFTVPPTTPTVDVGDLLVAAGQPNLQPYLRVTSVLISSTDRTVTPVLTGFQLTFDCAAAE